MTDTDEITAADGRAMAAFVLGTIMGTVAKADYPLKIRDSEEWMDAEDQIKSFVIITESGHRLHIKVDYEGEELTL